MLKSDARSLFDGVGEDSIEETTSIDQRKTFNKSTLIHQKHQQSSISKLAEHDQGLALILEKVKQSQSSAKEIALFMKKRAIVEEEYARSMHKLVSTINIKQSQSSFNDSIQAFYKLHESIADSKLAFSAQCLELSVEVGNLARNTERGRKELKESGLKNIKLVNEAEVMLEKASTKYESASDDWEKALNSKESIASSVSTAIVDHQQQPLKRGLTKSFSNSVNLWKNNNTPVNSIKICKQEEESRNKVAVANEGYKNQLSKTVHARQTYQNILLPDLLNSLKEVNDECDKKLKGFLLVYCRVVEATIMNEATAICPIEKTEIKPGMLEILSRIDVESDFDDFMEEYLQSHVKTEKSLYSDVLNASMSSINLQYQGPPSSKCFGLSLEECSIRDTHLVPIIVTKLISAIESHISPQSGHPTNLKSVGLYRKPGQHTQIQKLRTLLDKNVEVELNDLTSDINVMAGLLKLFFRELPDSLLPKAFCSAFIDASKCYDEEEILVKSHEVINRLPDPNYATLKAIMQHLNKIQLKEADNKMSKKNLGCVWGCILMDTAIAQINPVTIVDDFRYQSRVIEIIIQNFDDIFEV